MFAVIRDLLQFLELSYTPQRRARGGDKLDSPGASRQLIKPNRRTGAVEDPAQGQTMRAKPAKRLTY